MHPQPATIRTLALLMLLFFTPSAHPQQPCGNAPSVQGTTWDTDDSTGQKEAYEFQKGGSLVQYTSNGSFPNGTWKQNGACLSFEVNDGYVTFEARIEGDRFQATAQPRFGSEWTLTGVRRGGKGSGSAPSAKKAAPASGQKDGFSFTVDRSGKLVAVNNEPVDSSAGAASPKSSPEWEDLARKVVQLHQQAKFREALPVAERALKVAEQAFGPHDANVATSLNSLAIIYNALDKFDAAVPIAKRAVAVQEQRLGAEHADVGNALNTLGMSYSGQEKFVEAEETFERAIAITEKAKGPKDEQLGLIYNNLGKAYDEQDKYSEAETAYERALDILEEKVGPWDQRLAVALNNLAHVKKQKRDYDGALMLYERSLGVLERGVGESHPYVAMVLENLAALYKLKGWTKEAQEATERAQRIKSNR